MAASKDSLLSHLRELGVTVHVYEHPVVMTVEQQALHIGHLEGVLSKNLFLKDKKGRFYLVSAVPTTNVDLKALSQRLGLGKGGLRLAPEENLQEVLKVPLGSVTPFALINSSARSVIALLDQTFKSHSRIFFHPLINDSSVAITCSELDTFLKSIDREPTYVDLEAVVTVGKDQPPDLASIITVTADQNAIPSLTPENSVTSETPSKPTEAAVPVSKGKNVPVEKSSEEGSTKKLVEDAQTLLNYIFDQTISTTISKIRAKVGEQQITEELVPTISNKVKEEIAPDLESILMLFKNTAYTHGFTAAIARTK